MRNHDVDRHAMRLRSRLVGVFAAITTLALAGAPALAGGDNQLAVGVGAARSTPYLGQADAGSTLTVSYTHFLTNRFAVEASAESFPVGEDDFSALLIAGVYHFTEKSSGRMVPYVAIGIGGSSTDFTEFNPRTTLRLSAGVQYRLWEFFGLRLEISDLFVTSGAGQTTLGPGSQHVIGGKALITFDF